MFNNILQSKNKKEMFVSINIENETESRAAEYHEQQMSRAT